MIFVQKRRSRFLTSGESSLRCHGFTALWAINYFCISHGRLMLGFCLS